jgi:hypothetical protein
MPFEPGQLPLMQDRLQMSLRLSQRAKSPATGFLLQSCSSKVLGLPLKLRQPFSVMFHPFGWFRVRAVVGLFLMIHSL